MAAAPLRRRQAASPLCSHCRMTLGRNPRAVEIAPRTVAAGIVRPLASRLSGLSRMFARAGQGSSVGSEDGLTPPRLHRDKEGLA